MLKAHIDKHDNLIINGSVLQNEIYPNHCCQGFNWEVATIFTSSNPDHNSIYGVCQNPKCPHTDTNYQGVSHILQVDFAEQLANKE